MFITMTKRELKQLILEVVGEEMNINEVSDFQSDIHVMNEGLNNEYTSNNERILKELGNFQFTSHKNAIAKMRRYFQENLDKLDIQTIKDDPNLKAIDTMWKGK